jgi:5'-phosphate synthase pdxT subunit
MIGVLGLQGDFHAHARMLERAGEQVRVVKKPEHLAEVQGLVMPGGESTTLIKLMDIYGFWDPLAGFAAQGKAILGTCAGMILLAKEVLNPAQRCLGIIDITVERNSYGRQRESFETVGSFSVNGTAHELPMVLIRAPRILRYGPAVQPLATWGGECMMARQGRILVASFHPELTDDLRVHRYFLEVASGQR